MNLEKLAYTIECFLNATQSPESSARTDCETKLVYIFANNQKHYAIYHKQTIQVFRKDKSLASTLSLPNAISSTMIWCNGETISSLDQQAFTSNGNIILLGTAGLILTMPGIVQAKQRDSNSSGGSGTNSNNNNNNNNNNG